MFSNFSVPFEVPITYPILDSTLLFSDYIAHTRAMIEERRPDLSYVNTHAEFIINANTPFEFYPHQPIWGNKRLKYGALLIHGLLDCPFSLRDLGICLQNQGILSRAILLPGHGTTPNDLMAISYHDWIRAVWYGIESLQQDVENIFLIGYSTGAALSVYHALQNTNIAGIVLLSPAIKIKASVDMVVGWHQLTSYLSKRHRQWIYQEKEVNAVKYQSIPFNAVTQVSQLTEVIRELTIQHPLKQPIYMAISREDETVSSDQAMDFFSALPNPNSKLLLYSSIDHRYPDPRIFTRLTNYPQAHIKHLSHISLPFAPSNSYYGTQGHYQYASHQPAPHVIYGGYNHIEEKIFDLLYALKLAKYKRRGLTYNPDFEYMANEIVRHIIGNGVTQ
jgi:esterase/lipase